MERKERIEFAPVTIDVEQVKFDCGNSTLNGQVKQSYFPMLTQQVKTYQIFCGEEGIGFFQICLKELSISESVEESIEYYDESFNEKTLPVLYIRFLAIGKKFQKRGKGTLALKGILKLSRVLAKDFPFRAVVIEALPELEQWYVKMGFARMREEPNNLSLIPMLWDCGVYQSELNEYLVRH